MILDTSFLVDVLRGAESVADLERELDERGTATVTSVTIMELTEGARSSDASDEERERVTELLDGLNQADFDAESAFLAGELNAELIRAGERIDVEDVMIGAIARTRDEPVLTRNEDHFDRIPELDVRTY